MTLSGCIENEFFWEENNKLEAKKAVAKEEPKVLQLSEEDYDKLTYPRLIRMANQNSPNGEELYEKIRSEMQTINP